MYKKFDRRQTMILALLAALLMLSACGTMQIERVANETQLQAAAETTAVVSQALSEPEEAATVTSAAVLAKEAQATATVPPPTETAVPVTPTAMATETAVTSATEGNSGSEESQELSYRNDLFGFRLPLPDTWSGYEATQNDHENVSSICFTFTGSPPFCVLQIDVYPKAAWDDLDKVPDNYYLAENDLFVFAAGPYQPECVQLDDFQCERYQEIPAILEGFIVE